MKFRLMSRFGDGLGLAWALQRAGHDVDFYITEPACPHLYQGVIRRVDRWNKNLTPETIVLFDMVGLGKIADSMRATGHHVYGGGVLNDQLELDREFARRLAKNSGLKVPDLKMFEDTTEAIAELRGEQGGWIYRPVTNSPAPFIFVADTTRAMRTMLEYFGRSSPGQRFTLEPRLSGVEISIECWYVRGEPVPSTINSAVELTRFMAGGLGPQTGCMGSVAWFWKNQTNKLYRMTHEKLQPFLKRYDYDGPLNVRVLINEADQRPVFLDLQARFGYNAIYALTEDIGVDLAKVLSGVAAGQKTELAPSYQWCGALRVTSPPFPYRIPEAFAGKPLAGIDRKSPHFWPLDICESDGKLVTAGGDGVVCEVTAKSAGLKELGKALYAQADRMILPDKQYRVDMIEHARDDIERLTASKYLRSPKGEPIHA